MKHKKLVEVGGWQFPEVGATGASRAGCARDGTPPFQAAKSSSLATRSKKTLPAQDVDAGDLRTCL